MPTPITLTGTVQDRAAAIAQRCGGGHEGSSGWMVRCPAHDDGNPSLSITATDERVLLHCHAGCSTEAIVEVLGLTMQELFAIRHGSDKRTIAHIYDYVNENGYVVHQTVRMRPKGFSQRRPDPDDPRKFIWNLHGIETVLYHLPDVQEAIALGHPVYIVEGEKDADILQKQGLTATCNPMGAGKWKDSYNLSLKDAHVVILADFDEVGLQHAKMVATYLEGYAASIRLITDLHTIVAGSDVADWFADGGTRTEFDAIVESTPLYRTMPSTLAVSPTVLEEASKFPSLPDDVACEPPHLQTWLSAYVEHSTKWAPRAAPGYHAAIGLWVLSTIAARRIVIHMGSNDIFPTLFIALVSESTLWTKTTAASIGIRLLRRVGCGHLLSPDRTTPQYLLKLMSGIIPQNYGTLSDTEQEDIQKTFAFSAQRGWFYEEWGGMLHQMRRIDSPHAELNKLLIVLEGGASTFETGTIQRGLEHIDNPYLALLGNATPHDLLPFMGEGDAWWHDGFWPRFVFVTPPAGQDPSLTPMPREEYQTPHNLRAQLEGWHKELGVPDVLIEEMVEASGKRTGQWKGRIANVRTHSMMLNHEAYNAYEAYGNALLGMVIESKKCQQQEKPMPVHEDLWPWYGRAHQKALRVAMLLASVEGHGVIELAYWQEAQTIVEAWRKNLHEITAVINIEGQATRSTLRRRRIEKRIEYLLATNGKMRARTIQRHIKGISSEELQAILESMTKIGTITTEKDGKQILYLIFDDQDEYA